MNPRTRSNRWIVAWLVLAMSWLPILPALAAPAAADAPEAIHAHHAEPGSDVMPDQAAGNDAPCAQHSGCMTKCCGHCITTFSSLPQDSAIVMKAIRSPGDLAVPTAAPTTGPIRPPQIDHT